MSMPYISTAASTNKNSGTRPIATNKVRPSNLKLDVVKEVIHDYKSRDQALARHDELILSVELRKAQNKVAQAHPSLRNEQLYASWHWKDHIAAEKVSKSQVRLDGLNTSQHRKEAKFWKMDYDGVVYNDENGDVQDLSTDSNIEA